MTKKLENIEVANTLLAKGVGLIGRKQFGSEGLLLKNTNSIHTYGVRFPIDVVYLNEDFTVNKIVENLKPLHVSPIVWGNAHILELPHGAVKKHSLEVGDKIDLIN